MLKNNSFECGQNASVQRETTAFQLLLLGCFKSLETIKRRMCGVRFGMSKQINEQML